MKIKSSCNPKPYKREFSINEKNGRTDNSPKVNCKGSHQFQKQTLENNFLRNKVFETTISRAIDHHGTIIWESDTISDRKYNLPLPGQAIKVWKVTEMFKYFEIKSKVNLNNSIEAPPPIIVPWCLNKLKSVTIFKVNLEFNLVADVI